MNLIVATSNAHKLHEIRQLIPATIELIGLGDIEWKEEIPETGHTFAENALQKARFVFERTNLPVIADDSGLQVEALGGRPGIYSARFSGIKATDHENVEKLLFELKGIDNRHARFVTSIALIINGMEYVFEGISDGHISKVRKGHHGFGYDPVFVPEGYDYTFAELSADTKNEVGHRGRAVKKLVSFLIDSHY